MNDVQGAFSMIIIALPSPTLQLVIQFMEFCKASKNQGDKFDPSTTFDTLMGGAVWSGDDLCAAVLDACPLQRNGKFSEFFTEVVEVDETVSCVLLFIFRFCFSYFGSCNRDAFGRLPL